MNFAQVRYIAFTYFMKQKATKNLAKTLPFYAKDIFEDIEKEAWITDKLHR